MVISAMKNGKVSHTPVISHFKILFFSLLLKCSSSMEHYENTVEWWSN